MLDGHLETVSIKLAKTASLEEVKAAFDDFNSPLEGLGLPTAPERFIQRFNDQRYPQPRRHANLGNGMTVTVGRVRPCEVLDYKYVALSHNTIRGAAGGAVLNAELLVKQGYLKSRSAHVAVEA